MIIVDFSQIMISNLMAQLGFNSDATTVDEDFLRHLIVNSLRSTNMKFKAKYGEMVLACDAGNYWRKDIFPYYKAGRKKGREDSKLDWDSIFKSLNKIRDEIKENFPYRVIRVARSEGDDVIATLCEAFANTNEKILIVSGDKDMKQLQDYRNVEQYDPVKKKMLTENNPSKYLKELIIRGDGGDGIPNALSDDDTFVTNKRQKPVAQKKLDVWLTQDPSTYDEHLLRGFKRNEALIDFAFIPDYIKEGIMLEYKAEEGKNRSKLLNYCIQNRLKMIMENIQDI